ncbi:MAG: hypothetical protein LBS33_08085 [Streptococcaceae bacterium]|jgi:hypothetical protein|nr:hypothetical protein [Streptococcaceae bacterium]
MKKIIYLELLAFIREKFRDRKTIKVLIFMFSAYLLFGYALAFGLADIIVKNYQSVCQGIIALGLLGFLTPDRTLLRYYDMKGRTLFKFPQNIKMLLFIKSIKYELFAVSAFLLLLSLFSIPIFAIKSSVLLIYCVFISLFLFLTTNKLAQLLITICPNVKALHFIFEILGNLLIFLWLYFACSGAKNGFINLSKLRLNLIFEKLQNFTGRPYFSLLIILYPVLYYLLVNQILKQMFKKTKQNKTRLLNLPLFLSPIRKKIFQEFRQLSKFSLFSSIFFQLIAIVLVKFLVLNQIVNIDKISLTILFPILLLSIGKFLTNFSYLNLKFEGSKILLLIQSTYQIEKYLLQKAAVVTFYIFSYLLFEVLALYLMAFITLSTAAIVLIFLLFNIIGFSITVQIFSNLFVRYSSEERFENALNFPIASFVIALQFGFEELVLLLAGIVDYDNTHIYIFIAGYSMIVLLTNLLLLKILRRKFYGEYGKFIASR